MVPDGGNVGVTGTSRIATIRLARRHLAQAGSALLIAAGAWGIQTAPRAYADASAPPAFPTDCPPAQYPPAGYFNPEPGQETPPATYTGPKYTGPIPYKVPFKGIITGGEIKLGGTSPTVPSVVIPHLYAAVCGTVELPSLNGTVPADAINLATPNVYVAGLEALPASVDFGNGLAADLAQTAAANGGLDAHLSGNATASVSTLGMKCSITVAADFTTQTSGKLSGQPVTGPTMAGQAEVVANAFAIPKVTSSATCPPAIAATFNKLLGLPASVGAATFIAPFCFDFELEGINTPSRALNPNCPWPSS